MGEECCVTSYTPSTRCRVNDLRSEIELGDVLDGCPIVLMRKSQSMVCLFITKEYYMPAMYVCKEAIWIMKLCSNVGLS